MVAVNGGFYMYMVQTIENYCLLTLNLNVFVFFVSLCFQGFQRLAFVRTHY